MNTAFRNQNFQLLSGNHAVAIGAKLANPDVSPVYPITPQTPILEKMIELQSQGELETEIITPESEHSALAASVSASLTGARVFTATSSQGLLLMHELLHYAVGARSSIVMFNVNRTVASPWGFWPDQLDSLAQRDTGWIQLYSETPQESLDTVIQAFAIAESARLPVMINHDAFYVSHAVEPVEVPDQSVVDDFLSPFQPPIKLDPEIGRSFGAPIAQQTWNESRRDLAEVMSGIGELVTSTGRQWDEMTGRRNHGMLESYRLEDAEVVIATMGSMCGTVRDAVDSLRNQGVAAGLLKVRLFRPLPAAALREILAEMQCVIVLDRNYSAGTGGILHQELKGVLYGLDSTPKIHGLLAGVGGTSVSSEKIQQLVTSYKDAAFSLEPVWVE
ncbi:MAG: pyruvate ferredoxin oxidoreductase [Hyphomicrobiales bacterium]|nr:pyruvate ferredoxin oxidoreductase [Hyphomicrobiales bacterium]